jgi:hypothetical protein
MNEPTRPVSPGQSPVRNRIIRHVRVRAGDLVPHELNPRTHPSMQRQALRDLYHEVGFARSLLAYQLPDGQLKLIDGHLRRDLDPNMEVEVEVLDVDDEEARKLLLSIDPLAALAGTSQDTLDRLRDLTRSSSDNLTNLWRSIGQSRQAVEETLEEARRREPPRPLRQAVPEQYLVLVECDDETEQVALLERFQRDGLRCRALLS